MPSLLFHCESLMDVKLISTTPVMKYLILKSVFLWHGLVYHSCMMMMLEAVSQKILLKISISNFSLNLATKAKLKSNLSHFWFTPRFDIWRWTQSSKEKSGGNVKIYLPLNPNNAWNAEEGHLKSTQAPLWPLDANRRAGAATPSEEILRWTHL